MFVIMIGPPGTGKSQAINTGATEPLIILAEERGDKQIIIGRSTSAGLLKLIAANGKAMIVSGEIYDILFKLIKNDNDSGSGDTTLLCELFSGEVSSMNYATQNNKTIQANTPFCILGGSQPRPAFELLSMMADKSNGLHHRFLLYAPQCFRPTYTDVTRANEEIKELPTVMQFVKAIERLHEKEVTYSFSEESKIWLRSMHDEHAKQLNENIREGKPTCESKMGDHIERVAVSLHVLTTIGEKLLNPDSDGEHSHTVPQHTVEAAAKFVEHCEAQKEIIMKELEEILKPIIAGCKVQPKPDDLKPAILRFPGKAIT
nr:uncharacterized protein LOC129271795 [Lytechinus pictus]